MIRFFLVFISIACLFSACKSKSKLVDSTDILHNNQEQLTQLIIYDVFSPPVASRIYAYASLASYEAMRFKNPKYKSLTKQLNGFDSLPVPIDGKEYNYTLAATSAFFSVVHKVTFSLDSIKNYEDRTYGNFKNALDDSVYTRSVAFGEQVANVILKRAANDSYAYTRGKPKFLGSKDPGKWHPTNPDYMDGVESFWGDIKTLAVDSSSQFPLPPPPAYSEEKTSQFYKQNLEVYEQSKKLSQEQKDIARFWDDNPFVLEHSGHMMFATKKITPGGHWIGITSIASKQTNADDVKTAQAYALVSVAIFDGFISCWQQKYVNSYIRPISFITEHIDRNWTPALQTPPFPEYPSGHSTITRSAAVVLTHLFGDNFEFLDTSDLKYIGMQRNFKSFEHAANEASVSRFYGGIHYPNSLNKGAEQGKEIAQYILKTIKLKEE